MIWKKIYWKYSIQKDKQKSPGRATSRSRSQPLTPAGRGKVTQINVYIANKHMHDKHKDQLPLPQARFENSILGFIGCSWEITAEATSLTPPSPGLSAALRNDYLGLSRRHLVSIWVPCNLLLAVQRRCFFCGLRLLSLIVCFLLVLDFLWLCVR